MPTAVQRYWEDNAQSFDALYREDRTALNAFNQVFRRALRERLEHAVDACRNQPGARVLDVGCGSGRGSVAMALAGAGHVDGIDFSAPMLAMARHAAAEWQVADRCNFIEADFLEQDIEEPYDIVVALGVFDYVEEPVAFLKRMAQASKGRVLFSAPKPGGVRAPFRKWRYARRDCPVYFRDSGTLRQIAQDAGLKDIQVHPIQGGHVVTATSQG